MIVTGTITRSLSFVLITTRPIKVVAGDSDLNAGFYLNLVYALGQTNDVKLAFFFCSCVPSADAVDSSTLLLHRVDSCFYCFL